MKLITLLMVLLFSFKAYADAGSCVVYKAKYVLKNGQSITGLLPLYGYEDYAYLDETTHTNKYCNDKAFQQLINTAFYVHQHKLTFDIYTALHLVRYGKSAIQADNPNPYRCVFTDSSAVTILNLDSIRYTVFLSAETAGWDHPDVGIVLVDSKTSRMMQENDVFNHCGLYHEPVLEQPGSDNYYEFDGYTVLNYNQNISITDLKSEMERISPNIYAPELKYLNSKDKNRLEIFQQEQKQVIAPIIQRLEQKGIILIQVFPVY